MNTFVLRRHIHFYLVFFNFKKYLNSISVSQYGYNIYNLKVKMLFCISWKKRERSDVSMTALVSAVRIQVVLR
jgi:hypothetical protein